MAKKTKRPSMAQRNVTSVSVRRADNAVALVTPAFIDWCIHTKGMPADVAGNIMGPIKGLVTAYFQALPSSAATNFEPDQFIQALAEVINMYPEGEDTFALEVIHLYVDFLDDTDAWTGSQDHYNRVHEFFQDDEDDSFETPADLEGAERDVRLMDHELTPEAELTALSGTELVVRLEKLLRWLGAGRTVTNTGALRLKEIEGAAEAVGVVARGAANNTQEVRKAKAEQVRLFGAEGLFNYSVDTVKSMYEVPLLSKFWAALQECGLIDVRSTKVLPTLLAKDFLDVGDPGRLDTMRHFITTFLEIAVLGEDPWDPWVAQASLAQAGILFAACTNEAPAVDELSDPEKLQTVNLDHYGAKALQFRMDELAELGLVVMDQRITVPPAVIPAVLIMLQAMLPTEDGDAQQLWELEHLSQSSSSPSGNRVSKPATKRKKSANAQILQLKIMLKESKPPVWRRLLVDSELTLDQFHQVLQYAFGWLDCHLHEFRVGGYRGTIYGPVGNDFGFGDPPLDETRVTLGELLSKEKDKMDYVYDFGDDWDHAITVEKLLPYDDDVPAVRCTGGRGAEPAEDSGGVWGWQGIIQAVNDPTHPEHVDYRRWLGLGPGETFDPKEFDKDQLNLELSEMF